MQAELLPPSEQPSYTAEDALLNQYMKQSRIDGYFDGDTFVRTSSEPVKLILKNDISKTDLEKFRGELAEKGLDADIDWQGVKEDFVQIGVGFDNIERFEQKADYLASRYAVLKDRMELFQQYNVEFVFGTYKSADISRYTDIPRGSWHYDYIAQAVHMGTFVGYSSSRMGPDENITREQAIVVLARTVCLPAASREALARFPDRNQVGAWAADAVAAMVEHGYVNGYTNGQLNPKGQIIRAEMAQIMSNIFQSVYDSGEITGNYQSTVLVRGEANIHDAVLDGDLEK